MERESRNRYADAECARIASFQFGIISRRQALARGMTPQMLRHRIGTRRWEKLLPSVYRIAGASSSPQQSLMAACEWGGPGTVAFSRSAAAAWELHGGRWYPPEIASLRYLRPQDTGIILHRKRSLNVGDVTMLGPLPVTTVGRTLIDLSASVDERTLEIALDQALRSGRVSLQSLTRRLEELAAKRLPGVKLLCELVEGRDPAGGGTDSELETLVHRWLRKYGFPTPVFQHWVHLPDYGWARLDFAYPELKIGVEADSFKWHSSRSAFERDRARNSEFSSLDWIIIQTTSREIEKQPDRPANRLRRALNRRLQH
jgi:very-short-patch-repair endonuclease